MKDRLAQLLRQRDILREHLRWIDGEIDAARTQCADQTIPAAETSAAPPRYDPPEGTEAVSPPQRPQSEVAAPASEENLPDLDVPGLQREVRQGCLLYVGILAALGALMVGLIFLIY